MRKLTQKTWNKIHRDYKIIKNGKKYAMVDNSVLEPIEIDNENGEYYVKITFKINWYNEIVMGLYNPLESKETNFEKLIKGVIHYDEEYKFFIDSKKYEIIKIENYE